MKKICVLCGKEFDAVGRNASRRKYCDNIHYVKCQYCGKEFIVEDPANGIPKTCSKECANKLKIKKMQETMQDKYGITNPSQNSEMLKRAASSRKSVSAQTVSKYKITMLSKYGTDSPIKVPEIRQQIENTNLQKYGEINPAKSDIIRQKISISLQSEESQFQYKETSLSHFGTERPAQNEVIKNKMKETCERKYGTEWATQNSEVQKKISESMRKVYSENPEISKKIIESVNTTCKLKYGVDWPCQLSQCREAANSIISSRNKEIAEKIESLGLTVELEKHIGKYSFDLCIESIKTLIEINPTYTHNAVGNHWNPNGLDSKYHKNKSEAAKKHGYRCIHVFDWDDENKIINLLQPKTSTGARKCEIGLVFEDDCDAFLDKFHLQNTCKGQVVRLGLFYQDQLVQVMTFGKPRYNKNYEWELLRLCSDSKHLISGGAERLFKYFVNTFNPQSIISYCDLSKFTGSVYYKLGMTHLRNTAPTKVWSKWDSKITDSLLRQRGYDQLFGTDYGKGTSNEALMLEHGWFPVYDCGQAVYEWKGTVDDKTNL